MTVLILTLVVLAQSGSEYPKVVHRGTQVCVQVLDAKGSVEESCRAEGTEARTPLPSTMAADDAFNAPRPARRAKLLPADTAAMTAAFWADAKKNWALAFKIGAVAAMASTLVSIAGAVAETSIGTPHGADAYIATAAVSGVVAAIFAVIGLLLDTSAFHELVPSAADSD